MRTRRNMLQGYCDLSYGSRTEFPPGSMFETVEMGRSSAANWPCLEHLLVMCEQPPAQARWAPRSPLARASHDANRRRRGHEQRRRRGHEQVVRQVRDHELTEESAPARVQVECAPVFPVYLEASSNVAASAAACPRRASNRSPWRDRSDSRSRIFDSS